MRKGVKTEIQKLHESSSSVNKIVLPMRKTIKVNILMEYNALSPELINKNNKNIENNINSIYAVNNIIADIADNEYEYYIHTIIKSLFSKTKQYLIKLIDSESYSYSLPSDNNILIIKDSELNKYDIVKINKYNAKKILENYK
jgi:hypothetical protein